MTTTPPSEMHLTLPLSPQLRELIEQAAAQRGQSVDAFAASTLVEKACQILQDGSVRVLSERDAQQFLELLEADREPNEALQAAAERYRNRYA